MAGLWNNFLGFLNIVPTGLRINYSFDTPLSGAVIPSVPSGRPEYSGTFVGDTGNFYNISGSGFFGSGEIIKTVINS